MIVVDTSVWIEVWRDRDGRGEAALVEALAGEEPRFTRFTQAEMLQGARDEPEWDLLDEFFRPRDFLEMEAGTWARAARIYFDLRRRGTTPRSLIDCCIAAIVLEHDALLIHRDRDFEAIADVRPLRHHRFEV